MSRDKKSDKKRDTKNDKKDNKKNEKRRTIKLGERNEEGKLLTPHTRYGLMKDLKFMFQKIWQYKKSLLIIFVCGIFTQSIMRYLWGYIQKFLIDIVQAQTGILEKDMNPLFILLTGIVVAEIICIGGNVIVQNKVHYMFNFVRLNLITEKNDKLLSMNYQFLEQPPIMDLNKRAGNALGGDWNGFGGLLNRSFTTGALIITMIVSATTIVVLDPRLILVLTVGMLINYASQQWSIRDDKKHYWDKAAPLNRQMDYMERCTQDFDYAKDIRVFSMKEWLSLKQGRIFAAFMKLIKRNRLIWFRHSLIYCSSGVLTSSVMYYILITQVLHETVEIGDFTLYLTLCNAFSQALSDFYDNCGRMQEASNLTDDFRTFLDLNVEEKGDFLDINTLQKPYTFEFKNVSFRYQEAKEDTLKNLNLVFQAGERLAVVGQNGAGKSTFIKLLLRLYDATEGEILINGINVNQFKRKDYYSLFSPVFQNVELYAFPMAENVSMQTPEETDRDLADECLRKAGMSEKLNSLEKGSNTELLKILDDEGIDLSGGEKQKLALARALYKDAPVIVLDEPTAALDPIAEANLYQSFNEIIGDKSAVYISHRLSSTRFCDEIVMLIDGKIAEYGTHDELMKLDKEYAKMFQVQAQYYEENADAEEK